MFTDKKRDGINTFVCAVSLYVAETPKASNKDHGQPFSKELYLFLFLFIFKVRKP